MNKDSKIYLAGHDGLVGSAIYGELIKHGYSNIITRKFSELDLRNQADTELFFKAEKPEYVFLAAAKVGGIIANSTYKAEFIYDNIMIAANVIHFSWKYGVKKLLNLGSSCIYPKLAPQPLKEEYLLSGYLEETNDAYAMAKIAAIKMCNSYNEQYGTNFISVMPTNLYGPNDNFNLETSHVLPAMIRKMHLGKCLENDDWVGLNRDMCRNPIEGINENNSRDEILAILKKYGIEKKSGSTSVTLWGDGSPLREFLYSEDLAEAVVFLMNNIDYQDLPEGFINVGSGSDLSIKDLSVIVKDVTGFSGIIQWDITRPNGTPRKLMDVTKIKNAGWIYKTSLGLGIEKMYNWYINSSSNK
jgi:GDP-L-fucose synthase